MKKIKHFSLRIDEETLEKLKQIAKYEKRSVNKQIIYFIKRGIENKMQK